MKLKSILLVILIGCFSSCIQKRHIYSNHVALTPVFREKKDAFATAYYQTNANTKTKSEESVLQSSVSNGACIQGGYALTKHFGLAGGFSYLSERTFYSDAYAGPFDTSNLRYNRTEFSVAGDYFFSTMSKKAGMNIIGGITKGNLTLTDNGKLTGTEYKRHFKTNSFSAFIQPCVSAFIENASISFFLKYSYISFSDIRTDYTEAELNALRLNNLDPFYTAEFGFKLAVDIGKLPISLDGQFNYIYNYSALMPLRRANIAMGATYNLGRGFKK